MKPPAFEYLAASSVDEAVAVLAAHEGEAKIIAGGQSLVPMLNFRLLAPSVLVDINRIPELSGIEADGEDLRVGALTRHHALETSELVRERLPVLAEAMKHVAHLAIRNRGTIGGSLAHADPAAELPMMAVLLEARITVAGPDGSHEIDAADLFEAALSTTLGEDQMVTAVRFPALPAGHGWGFEEVAQRAGDFALAAAAAIVTRRGESCGEVRLALMGVGETPLRITDAEKLLSGRALDAAALDDVAAAVAGAIEPMSDLHASADYRRHLARVLSKRVLTQAWERAA